MQIPEIYAEPFFAWLWKATLQGSLLVCLILLIKLILRHRLAPRWHFALWLILLARLSLPWAPPSRLSIYNLFQPSRWRQQQIDHVQKGASESISRSQSGETAASKGQEESRGRVGGAEGTQGQTARSKPTAVGPEPATQEKRPPTPSQTGSWLGAEAAILPLVWLVGVVGLGGYMLIRSLRLWLAVRRERPVTDQEIAELLEDCKMQMGVQTIVGVVVTDKVKSPALFGFVRPRLLLPEGLLEALSLDELHHVFLHELAHLRRRDIYTSWWAAVLQIAHWFNPLIWFAFRRMRADQEMAADALALRHMAPEEPPVYGRTIVGLLERFSQPHYVPSVAGILEEPSHIERRMTMIARFKINSADSLPFAIALIVGLSSISLLDAQDGIFSGVSSANAPVATYLKGHGAVIREQELQHQLEDFALTPSGDKMVYCSRRLGKLLLLVRDLRSGTETQIAEHKSWTSAYPIISPDGNQIIYTLLQSTGGKREATLHMLATHTGTDCKLDLTGRAGDWSPDGRFILVLSEEAWIVSFHGESANKIKMSLSDDVCPWRFSPDGEYISCFAKGNLYVYCIDGAKMTQITTGSNGDKYPLWSPDGRSLIFLSRRRFGPELDLCRISIADGNAVGDVQVIQPDFGDNVELGSLSNKGQLFYIRSFEDRCVFRAPFDSRTGRCADYPTKLASGTEPTWSPDGRQIAYLADGVLHVMTAEGADDREIAKVNFPSTGTYAWAADGDYIYIPEYEVQKVGVKIRVYAVSLATGEKQEVPVPHEDVKRIVEHLTCSPDGKHLAFIGKLQTSGKSQVFTVETDGTNLQQLTFDEEIKWYPAWSPDGRKIAYESGPPHGRKALTVVGVEDRTTRELFHGETPEERFFRKSWSPDGEKIIWEADDGARLGNVSTGVYNTLRVEVSGVSSPSWSPKGEHLLFGTWVNLKSLMVMGDFLPEADSARASESTTSSAVNQPAFTKIRIPNKIRWDAQLSPDGEHILFVNDQKLWLMPRSGRVGSDLPGEARMLDTGGVAVEWCGLTWSGDGQWIAFNGAEVHEGRQKIYVVPSGGGIPRRIHENNRDARIVNYRMSLSPDGKTLAFTQVDANELHIYTMPVDGGPPKQLVEAPAREPAFSPDGTKIAYVRDRGLGRAGGGLWVVPADGGNPTRVADGTNATSPVWSPDGRMLAFIDDGRVHIVASASEVSRLDTKVTIDSRDGLDGARRLAGWTRNNRIGVVFEKEMEFALYSQAVQGGKPTFVTYGGYPTQPRWSPDGERIFYVNNANDQSTDWVGHAIAYVPARGGAVHAVALNAESKIRLQGIGTGNHVSPDGRTIVFAGHKAGQPMNTMHIWTLPVEGGTPQQLTDAPAPLRDWYPCWSPDGQSIAFVRMKASKNWAEVGPGNIFTVPVSGGQPRQITTESDGVFSFGPVTWSPNGKLLAYFSRDGKGTSEGAIKIIGAEGGEPRVVVRVQEIAANKEMAWSPDGKRIAYNAPDNKIKIVSIDDGDIEEIVPDLQDVQVYHLDWSPDGKKLVFAGASGGGPEFWMVDNFLPPAVASVGQ